MIKTQIDYSGFTVFYSKGTSIVERYKRDGVYEPEVLLATERLLQGVVAPVILDIGANIGFFSLPILKKFPKAKIYAFEPGPHQFNLFSETIKWNNLKANISLEEIALSYYDGFSQFRIHHHSDASGDGFVDTNRAGKTKKIKVKTCTLDTWEFQSFKENQVHLVKMDTEGAEYWILKGGNTFFSTYKPTVIIEIHHLNIKNFPFEIEDLLDSIAKLGYLICHLDGKLIDTVQISNELKETDTFLLIHREKLNTVHL